MKISNTRHCVTKITSFAEQPTYNLWNKPNMAEVCYSDICALSYLPKLWDSMSNSRGSECWCGIGNPFVRLHCGLILLPLCLSRRRSTLGWDWAINIYWKEGGVFSGELYILVVVLLVMWHSVNQALAHWSPLHMIWATSSRVVAFSLCC